MILLHVCRGADVDGILTEGLRAGSYLTSREEVAGYYAETIEDEGETPAILELDFDALIVLVGQDGLEPDRPSIAEPITIALGCSEADVQAAWAASAGTFQDSLRIVGSLRVRPAVPAILLREVSSPARSRSR